MAPDKEYVFDYEAPTGAETLSFRIMGEEFEVGAIPSWVYFDYIDAMVAAGRIAAKKEPTDAEALLAGEKTAAIRDVFRGVMDDGQYDRFVAVMRRPGAPDMDQLVKLVEALTARGADRPTNGSSPARRGPSRMPRTSAVAALGRASDSAASGR